MSPGVLCVVSIMFDFVLINVKRHNTGSIVYFLYTRRRQRSHHLNISLQRQHLLFFFGPVEFNLLTNDTSQGTFNQQLSELFAEQRVAY